MSSTSNIKSSIDSQEAAKPNGGSKTPIILAIIGIVLVILFIIVLLLFFFLFNNPPTHQITVTNTTDTSLNIIVSGMMPDKTYKSLPTQLLAPDQSINYQATPGVNVMIQGYANNTSTTNLTSAIIQFAGETYSGGSKISDGNNILTGFQIFDNSVDEYGVSVQSGYNFPITINTLSCTGPIWKHPVKCPPALQTGTICLSACSSGITGSSLYCCTEPNACSQTGGCEADWPNQDYYHAFYSACPTCMITNCDTLNYNCTTSNNNELSQYNITFLQN